MTHTKSEELFRRAQVSIPGGVNSPVRAFRSVGGDPVFIARGEGSHLFDADGNEYIDYVGSWGPLLLGHRFPPVIEALREVLETGTSFGAPTEQEIELAGDDKALHDLRHLARSLFEGVQVGLFLPIERDVHEHVHRTSGLLLTDQRRVAFDESGLLQPPDTAQTGRLGETHLVRELAVGHPAIELQSLNDGAIVTVEFHSCAFRLTAFYCVMVPLYGMFCRGGTHPADFLQNSDVLPEYSHTPRNPSRRSNP